MQRQKGAEWREGICKKVFMDRASKQNEHGATDGKDFKPLSGENVVGEPLAAAELLLLSNSSFTLQCLAAGTGECQC